MIDQRKFYIKTFGCQMNEHDSEKVSAILEAEGHLPVTDPRDADIILFNTCTVREKSHHKAISEVGKALQLKKRRPDVIVGVLGCVAQEEKGHLFELFPALDIVLGPDQIYRLPALIKSGRLTSLNCTEFTKNFITPTHQHTNSPTQFISIMKGCNNFCSFCIVPYVRGREVSKSPDDIITEIKNYSEAGVKEVTLLGQNVNSYGNDNRRFGGFPELLRRIAEETEILRIRYTSPHPKDLSDKLIEEHGKNKKLCEHIHLPVQAGASSVLERMNRGYTKEEYLEKISLLKDTVPRIAVTTDIIVGFPGEKDTDFEETLDLMRRVEFDGMFAFKYSPRKGTSAAKRYKDDVPEQVKRERLSQVLELNQRIVLQKHGKYVGTTEEILVLGSSERGGEQLTGRTMTSKIVNFNGSKKLVSQLVSVRITWAGPNSLKGEVLC